MHETRKEEVPSYVVDFALKQGATDVVTELADETRVMIRFSRNEATVSEVCREALLNVFLMIEKQRAAATAPLSSVGNLRKAVAGLVKTAKIIPPAEVYAPLPRGPFEYDPRLVRSPRISLEPEKLIGYVEEAMNSALEAGAKEVAGTLVATKEKNTLATSGHVNATQDRTSLELSVRAFTSDIASGHFVSVSRDEEAFKPGQAGRVAGEIAKAASNPCQGEPGKSVALLGPMVFADLISQVGIMSSAFLVDIGQSFLVNKIGSQVACDKFTLVDDPTDPDSFGGRPFDDEGVPTRKNAIVDKGILKTYLHNSTTAKKYDTKTTANAGLISPVPWNLIVEPGEKSFEQLLEEIDKGIYVTNDWYLRYQNYQTGDFSTIPRDGMFVVKHGEISDSVRELRISDNLPRIFQNILELSRSRSWIKWWEVDIPTLAPYAIVEDLNFTKSSM